jgi:pectinesterase
MSKITYICGCYCHNVIMKILLSSVFLLLCSQLAAQDLALADSIVKYQMASGGWPKNQDWLRGPDPVYMAECRQTGIGSTIDNGATVGELKVLAKVLAALTAAEPQPTRVSQPYRDAFFRGLDYLLDIQYLNGGWPQFWPQRSAESYSNHITFNDNAMVGVMRLLKDVADAKAPYDSVGADPTLRRRCREAFRRGVQCILDCQIRDGCGRPTVWCQQHDEHTLAPAAARKYELAACCGHGETAGILSLLIDLNDESPDDTLRYRIGCAVDWLERHAIHDMRLESFTNADGKPDKRLVHSPGAPDIWARFYDLETGRPVFSDRRGLPLSSFDDVEYERRNGYAWFGDSPAKVIRRFRK